MKHFLLFSMLLSVLLLKDITLLLSQDRPPFEIDTPEPCNYYSSLDACPYTPWDTQDQYQKVVIGGCTFWVVYRDRSCTRGQLGTIYETNVTGIIYSGTGCNEVSNAQVLREFRLARYLKVFENHPDWYPWNNGE